MSDQKNNNNYAFLNRLPDAAITGDMEKSPGVLINAAFAEGRQSNVIWNLLHGEKIPQRTYTVSIAGRGALTFGEAEFRDILSAGIALFETTLPGFVSKAVVKDAPLPSMDFLSDAG